MERECMDCGRGIELCNGFTHAGDYVEWLAGRRIEMPRERCGRCVLACEINQAAENGTHAGFDHSPQPQG